MIDVISDRERYLARQIDEQGAQLVAWRDRAIAAEAELARLREQRPVAIVDGHESSRYMAWRKDVAAFDYPIGTPVYAAPPAQPAEPAQRLTDERIKEFVVDYGIESLRLGAEEARYVAGVGGSKYRASFLRDKRREALCRAMSAIEAAILAKE